MGRDCQASPARCRDRDSELVREIRGESDLLREIAPSSHDLETVAAAFFELIGQGGPARSYSAARALRRANPALDVGGAAVAMTVIPHIAGRIKAREQQRKTSPVADLLAAGRAFTQPPHSIRA